MKFTTIWSLRAMSLTERLRRTRDWAAMAVARTLPRRIRYWSTLGDLGAATATSPDVPATTLSEILRQLPAPKSVS